jgi:MYXO-CTERM domain-containing protein
MRESLRALTLAAVTAAVVWSGEARSDVAPADSCPSASSVGQACSNAGPSADLPGVCVNSTCEHPTPDGSTSYSCVLCEVVEGGVPDSGSSSGGGSGGGSGSSGGASKDSGVSDGGGGGGSSKSGCSLSPVQREGATGFAMLALGVGALAVARRRRP